MTEDDKVHQVEILISNLLKAGVLISLGIIVLGTVVTFIHHPDYLSSHTDLQKLTTNAAVFPRTPSEMLTGLGRFEGRSIVILGLLLLVATPVLRVAVSIVAFVYQRDLVFVLITTTVLALLLLSFVLKHAE